MATACNTSISFDSILSEKPWLRLGHIKQKRKRTPHTFNSLPLPMRFIITIIIIFSTQFTGSNLDIRRHHTFSSVAISSLSRGPVKLRLPSIHTAFFHSSLFHLMLSISYQHLFTLITLLLNRPNKVAILLFYHQYHINQIPVTDLSLIKLKQLILTIQFFHLDHLRSHTPFFNRGMLQLIESLLLLI